MAEGVKVGDLPRLVLVRDSGRREEPESLAPEDVQALAVLDEPRWFADETRAQIVRKPLTAAAAAYFLRAKSAAGRPLDPVARFHLGNGARLERLNFLGDVSRKGLAQSHGLMVNYMYDLAAIEKNHESYADTGAVAAAGAVEAELRTRPNGRPRMPVPAAPRAQASAATSP